MLAVIMPEFFSNDFNQFLLVNQANTSFFLMLIFALVGGLLSSLSPCVLSLLPLNLAYIGTLEIEDKKAAFNKAAAFVLGASIVMGLLGALVILLVRFFLNSDLHFILSSGSSFFLWH